MVYDSFKTGMMSTRPSEMGFYGQVYLITNKINGKLYVGQTTQSINSRWQQHVCNDKRTRAGKITVLKNAILKYGKENFELKRLDFANSIEELNNLEEKYIIKYNSMSPIGYNIEKGGKHAPLSEESLRKLRIFTDSLKGKKVGPARGLKAKGPNNSLNKPVLALNTETGKIQEYCSLTIAAETFGVSKQSILSAIKYHRKSCNLYWSYKHIGLPIIGKSTKGPAGKKVVGINLDTGEKLIFDSLGEAARLTGQARTAIAAVCNGLYSKNKNFIWNFEK